MYEMTLDGLIRLMNSWFGKNKGNWLILWVSVNDAPPEMIINPKENFQAKETYLKSAYNDDLTLKNNTDIKIVNYDVLESLKELRY